MRRASASRAARRGGTAVAGPRPSRRTRPGRSPHCCRDIAGPPAGADLDITVSIVTLIWRKTSQLFALGLIVLAALPFATPFAVCDLSHGPHSSAVPQVHRFQDFALLKGKLAVDVASIALVATNVSRPALDIVVCRFVGMTRSVRIPQTRGNGRVESIRHLCG